jgi:hypothetical protein
MWTLMGCWLHIAWTHWIIVWQVEPPTSLRGTTTSKAATCKVTAASQGTQFHQFKIKHA